MENINIDFNPNTALSDKQRLADVETYLKALSARVKFCFANLYDEVNTADSENRIRRLENLIYPALAGSSNGVTVENAVIIQEKDAAYLVHEYETVEYIAGNKIGYLAQPSLIISNGYTADPRYKDQYRYTDMTFVKGGRWTNTQYDNYRVYLEIVSASYQGYTTVRIRTNDYTGSSYKTYDMTKTSIALNYDTIYPPTSAFPYGYAKFRLVLYCVDSGSTSAAWKETVEIYCGFASLAEYNAAVGLTYEPNTLTAVEETVTTE